MEWPPRESPHVCGSWGFIAAPCGGEGSDQNWVVQTVGHAWCRLLLSILCAHKSISATRLWSLRQGIKWVPVRASYGQAVSITEVKAPTTSDVIFIGLCLQGPESMDPDESPPRPILLHFQAQQSLLILLEGSRSPSLITSVLFTVASFVKWDPSSCVIKAFSSIFPPDVWE